jgi:hypothetical protein
LHCPGDVNQNSKSNQDAEASKVKVALGKQISAVEPHVFRINPLALEFSFKL